MPKIRVLAIALGVISGLLLRATFARNNAIFNNSALGMMSLSFLFVVPLVLGYLTAHWGKIKTYWSAIGHGSATICISMLVTAVLAWEGSICIVFLLPAALVPNFLSAPIASRAPISSARAQILPAVSSYRYAS